MSGGHWEYKNSDLANEMFGWHLSPHYGERGFSQAAKAREINPMDDREVSEMIWDVMCLLYSADYYHSGDIGYDTYKEDLDYFKKKWFKRSRKDAIAAYKNDLELYYLKLRDEFDRD